MPKYAEGNQVILPVSTIAASSATMIAADSQLATLLGPRDILLPLTSHPGGGSWVFNEDHDPPRWEETTVDNSILHIDWPVHAGMYIDAITLLLGGNADGGESPDGEIVVYRAAIADSTTKAVVATLDDTDPWAISGAGPRKFEFTSLAITIAKGYLYWLELASCGGGAGGDESYYYGGVLADAQLGA